jgi:Cof subfamily protein (haloacid dehalogenase superfamily)
MQNKYKLLVSDIDGTLTDSKGVISPADLKALQDLEKAGIKVSLSTGRAARGCQAVLTQMPAEGFHIFFEGALVCNSTLTEIIYSRSIDKQRLAEIRNLAHLDNLTLELFSPTGYFVERESALATAHSEMMGFGYTVTDFNSLCMYESIIMGCLVIPTSEQMEFRSVLVEFGEKKGLRFTWSMNPARKDIRFVNIIMDDISKERALKTLCGYYGIRLDEVAAIGDGAEDISLLKSAGFSIAMENAPEELKVVADEITAGVKYNGFSQAIQEFLLQ